MEPCNSVVQDPQRGKLLWLMTHTVHELGWEGTKARLPGYMPPPVLSGMIEDHRPDLTCRQSDRRSTPTIIEVVTEADVADPAAENRWTLLNSAARLYQAELHFVVPAWGRTGDIPTALRNRLASLEITPNQIWQIEV